jgi:lysyl-tRNA synthetase, class I
MRSTTTKTFRLATADEAVALKALDTMLAAAPATATGGGLQDMVYAAGKENGYTKDTLRSWFQAIYEVLLGQSQGPRFGSFIELYGVPETRALIARGLKGELVS